MATYRRPEAEVSMGVALAAARMAAHLTQRELADRIGASARTISRWELDSGAPRIGDRPRLVDALAGSSPQALATLRVAFGMPPVPLDVPRPASAAPSHARFALEAALFAMAEATDCSPRAVRAGAFALLSHLALAGIGVDDARAMLAGK